MNISRRPTLITQGRPPATGRVLLRPQQHHAAATVADFPSAVHIGQRRGIPAPNDRMNAYPMLAWRSFARLGRLQRLTANRATWISFVSGRALDAGQSSS